MPNSSIDIFNQVILCFTMKIFSDVERMYGDLAINIRYRPVEGDVEIGRVHGCVSYNVNLSVILYGRSEIF